MQALSLTGGAHQFPQVPSRVPAHMVSSAHLVAICPHLEIPIAGRYFLSSELAGGDASYEQENLATDVCEVSRFRDIGVGFDTCRGFGNQPYSSGFECGCRSRIPKGISLGFS